VREAFAQYHPDRYPILLSGNALTLKPSLGTENTYTVQEVLSAAHAARNASQWERAVNLYQHVERVAPQSAELKHNIGLCFFGWGRLKQALEYCQQAIACDPNLWQSAILLAKSYQALGQVESAQQAYVRTLNHFDGQAQARLGLADLAMNQFGNPLEAIALVEPLLTNPQFEMDAQLTGLMASLYDRDNWNGKGNALALSQEIKQFAASYLQLPDLDLEPLPSRKAQYANSHFRPRVGLISPLFCISPVYFMTIAGWQHVAKGCDIVIFNRGHQSDWATQAFRDVSTEWQEVQHMSAPQLARAIHAADIDVLYDLGGWMDVIALKALSVKPARQMFKWVGGQSVTTGLNCFDGWIGDSDQSPLRLQNLYSEPLINVPGGYCTYTPPQYMPSPAKRKSKTPCIFANPAKVSRGFLSELAKMKGAKVFIHNQYRFAQVQERIRAVLGQDAQFVMPSSHQEALEAVNSHATMIDTFPYSSGLTAREAIALGTKVKVLKTGELFCERHTASLV